MVRTLWILLGLGLVLLGLFFVGSLFTSGRARTGPKAVLGPGQASASERPVSGPSALVSAPPRIQIAGDAEADTTVLWPVELTLDLIRADYLPQRDGVEAIGSGRTARLSGRIGTFEDESVEAEVRFVAGPNTGIVLSTDGLGRFGSKNLFPGLSIVEVSGAGIPGSRREVRLRQNREALLNIGYGRQGSVAGEVIDLEGEPIEGASLNFDGQRAYSGTDGGFYLPAVAGGQCLVEVEKEGYALFRETVNVTAGQLLPKGRLRFALQPSCKLEIIVPDNVGGPGPVQVHLLPAQARDPNRDFPWYQINPIEVRPGRPIEIDGLPARVIKLIAFRAGARAPQKVINLSPDRPQRISLPLEPLPQLAGRVLDGGEPVAFAQVRLSAPNQVRATLGFFREPSWFLESEVFELMPPAYQETVTDAEGRFRLSAWSDVVPVRYLDALSPDGLRRSGRLVSADETSVDLELGEFRIGAASLVIDFPDRWQGLPVEIVTNGTPRAPQVLPAHEKLVLEGLIGGRWSVAATWHRETLLAEKQIELGDETELTIRVPLAAIEGQDEEAWTRAGRTFPY